MDLDGFERGSVPVIVAARVCHDDLVVILGGLVKNHFNLAETLLVELKKCDVRDLPIPMKMERLGVEIMLLLNH